MLDVVLEVQSPTAGIIEFGGLGFADLDPQEWSNFVGFVPQDVPVFNQSLMFNVLLKDPPYSDEEASLVLRIYYQTLDLSAF